MNKKSHVIVHISPYYPPHVGGLERVAQSSAEELARRGYSVRVITSTASGIKRGTEKFGNLRVTALPSFEFAHTPIAPTFPLELLALPKNSLIHLHLSQAFFPEYVLSISKLRGIPYIVHFHLDVKASGYFGPIFKIYKKIVWGPLLRNAKKVIACSFDQVALINEKYGVPKENIVLISNAVSSEFFTKRTHHSSKEKLRLLYVGRLAFQKRVERIIEAMSKISIAAQLTVVGDGDQRHELEMLVKNLKLKNIEFVGKKNAEEVRKYHALSDALVISSDEEGTSLVILEAMAAGLPIVGTNVRGIHDIIDGVGVLVDKPYSENMAKAIDELGRNPQKLDQLSKQSSERAKEYSWPRFMEQLETVYQSVIE